MIWNCFISLLSLVYLLFFLLGFVHPFYWFSEFVPFRAFFSSHFCLPVCSCRVFHSAGCKVVLFTKLLFNDLRFFAGYWFWAIARFVVFLLRPDKICDSGLFPFTVTLPESHSLLTCSNQRSIVTETLYKCYIVLQLNYLRINILQLIFGFSVLLLFLHRFRNATSF